MLRNPILLLIALMTALAACAPTTSPDVPTLAPTLDSVAASPTPESADTTAPLDEPLNLGDMGRLQVDTVTIVDEQSVGYIADLPQPTADWVATTGGISNGSVVAVVQVIPSEAGSSSLGALERAYGAELAANAQSADNGVVAYVDDTANGRFIVVGNAAPDGVPVLLEVTPSGTTDPLATWLPEYVALLSDVTLSGAG